MTFKQEHIEELEQLQKQKENERIQQELDLAIIRLEFKQFQQELDIAIKHLEERSKHDTVVENEENPVSADEKLINSPQCEMEASKFTLIEEQSTEEQIEEKQVKGDTETEEQIFEKQIPMEEINYQNQIALEFNDHLEIENTKKNTEVQIKEEVISEIQSHRDIEKSVEIGEELRTPHSLSELNQFIIKTNSLHELENEINQIIRCWGYEKGINPIYIEFKVNDAIFSTLIMNLNEVRRLIVTDLSHSDILGSINNVELSIHNFVKIPDPLVESFVRKFNWYVRNDKNIPDRYWKLYNSLITSGEYPYLRRIRTDKNNWNLINESDLVQQIKAHMAKKEHHKLFLHKIWVETITYHSRITGFKQPHYLFTNLVDSLEIPKNLRNLWVIRNICTWNNQSENTSDLWEKKRAPFRVFENIFFEKFKKNDHGQSKCDIIYAQFEKKFHIRNWGKRRPTLYRLKQNQENIEKALVRTYFDYIEDTTKTLRRKKSTRYRHPEIHKHFDKCAVSSLPFIDDIEYRYLVTFTDKSRAWLEIISNIDQVNTIDDLYRLLYSDTHYRIAISSNTIISFEDVLLQDNQVKRNPKELFMNENFSDGINAYIKATLENDKIVNKLNQLIGDSIPKNLNFEWVGYSNDTNKVNVVYEDFLAKFGVKQYEVLVKDGGKILGNHGTRHIETMVIDEIKAFVNNKTTPKELRRFVVHMIHPEDINGVLSPLKHKNIIESMKENIAGGVINIQYWSEAPTISSLGNIFNALRLAKWTRTGYYLTESDDIVSNAMTRLQDHGIENVMHVELEQMLNIWDDDIVCLLKNIIRRYYNKSKSL